MAQDSAQDSPLNSRPKIIVESNKFISEIWPSLGSIGQYG
jgi:hypothetical protein